MSSPDLRARTRADYPFQITHHTRFSDTDQYGHINNAISTHLIDTVVNVFLHSRHGPIPWMDYLGTSVFRGLPTPPPPPQPQPHQPPFLNLTVSTKITHLRPLHFPGPLHLCLAVVRLTRSTVTYEVAVFPASSGEGGVAIVGEFVQCWVVNGGVGGGRPLEGGRAGERRVVKVGDGDGRKGEVVVRGGIEEGVWAWCRRAMRGGDGGEEVEGEKGEEEGVQRGSKL